jgi:hypothetical protein
MYLFHPDPDYSENKKKTEFPVKYGEMSINIELNPLNREVSCLCYTQKMGLIECDELSLKINQI